MSIVSQLEWDQCRYEILQQAAALSSTDERTDAFNAMLKALTTAFDRPVPSYSAYRRANSFKAGKWPLIQQILQKRHLVDTDSVDEVLRKVERGLNAIRSEEEQDQLQLEVELDVLRKLLGELA